MLVTLALVRPSLTLTYNTALVYKTTKLKLYVDCITGIFSKLTVIVNQIRCI